MSKDDMEVDEPASASSNAMSMLMPSAKGKAKEAANGSGDGVLTEKELREMNTRDGLPWVEKYRPNTLDEVVAHQDITATLEKFIEAGRLPHLLLYGPPGTGKTSTVLALARRLYGPPFRKHVLELNASDDRGIDVVRDQIKSFAMTKVLFSKGFKLVILDEADMMTQAAQSALRRVIEMHTKNVRFCILCNYVNKIAPAIQSRCTRFRFSPLPEKEVQRKVDEVVQKEGVNITEDGRAALLKLSRGDMRRALNVLQACHAAYDRIDESAVYNCTGNPDPKDIERVVQSMMSDEFGTSFNLITALKTEKGLALQDLITGAYDFLQTVDLPTQSRVYLLDHLGSCEHRLSVGGSEKMQLTALLGAFKIAIELSQKQTNGKR
ncbi:P-loop containing nucleoside triphosphate hydrolase protein [Kockovaella imperatae]|uniref:Replication factor C subunit 3 n=1 Tax=Kockovaella imperatae TaxID=4999 RepID=A0A1Y1UIV4_9TREE|nr:P-loop containing nucleoside triphosphate hydrolase protein [Kockovaella imperatae]ORX37035.1 P-loop containing nucleoside triphosphate hydrolase protein [Kockovaella imperatae]